VQIALVLASAYSCGYGLYLYCKRPAWCDLAAFDVQLIDLAVISKDSSVLE